MIFGTKHAHKRGDIVKLSNEDQLMEITYVNTYFFSHDKVSVIYLKPDGGCVTLNGFHPESLKKVR